MRLPSATMRVPRLWMVESRSPPAEAALEAAVPAVEAAVLLEEEQPLRLSTPAAAITLIREIKVLLFMVGFLSVGLFNFA